MSEEKRNEPFMGRVGALVVSAVVTGVVSVVVLGAVNAPQKVETAASKRSDEQARDIAELRDEIAELRDSFNEYRVDAGTDIKKLGLQVETSSGDRFTTKDWERENARLQERQEGTRRDIDRLTRQVEGIVAYLRKGEGG